MSENCENVAPSVEETKQGSAETAAAVENSQPSQHAVENSQPSQHAETASQERVQSQTDDVQTQPLTQEEVSERESSQKSEPAETVDKENVAMEPEVLLTKPQKRLSDTVCVEQSDSPSKKPKALEVSNTNVVLQEQDV